MVFDETSSGAGQDCAEYLQGVAIEVNKTNRKVKDLYM
jgi:hypothetical protein